GIAGLVTPPRTELVVVVVLHARCRQVAVEGLEVLARGARPSVKQQQLEVGVVAHPLGPHGEASDPRVDRDPAGAARQPVVAVGVVEVALGGLHGSPPYPSRPVWHMAKATSMRWSASA